MTPLVVLGTLVAGSVGAVVRYVIQERLSARPAPWTAVLFVNSAGSALAGGVLALPQTALTEILVVGFAGALTTFSTLALQLVKTPSGPPVTVLLGRGALHIAGAVGGAWVAFHIVSLIA